MKKLLIVDVVIVVGLAILSVYASQAVAAQPKVVVDNPVFNFGSIAEGSHVSHEFIIKNSGDTMLHITKVKPP